MSLKYGNGVVHNLYLGALNIGKAYLGDTLVYEKGVVDNIAIITPSNTNQTMTFRLLTDPGVINVDWGDGVGVPYTTTGDITISDIPSGEVRIGSIETITRIWFITNTFNNISMREHTFSINTFDSMCNGLSELRTWDTIADHSAVTSYRWAFRLCNNLTSFPMVDTILVTTFQEAWSNCFALTSFPAINTQSAQIMQSTWNACSGITEFPVFNTSNCDNFNFTFAGCTSLSEIPAIDTSNGTQFWGFMRGTRTVTSPVLDLSGALNMREFFKDCTLLTNIQSFGDTSVCTEFYETFNNCPQLTCIVGVNTTAIIANQVDMFVGSNNLTAPSLSDQALLEVPPGLNYINPGSCPASGFVAQAVKMTDTGSTFDLGATISNNTTPATKTYSWSYWVYEHEARSFPSGTNPTFGFSSKEVAEVDVFPNLHTGWLSTGDGRMVGALGSNANTWWARWNMAWSTSGSDSFKWVHVMGSVDVTNGIFMLYKDGVDQGLVTDTGRTTDIPWNSIVTCGFKSANLNANSASSFSEVWFSTEYIDLTIQANRDKFYQAGAAVDLGADGSTPTGTQPLYYFSGDATSFLTNKGTLDVVMTLTSGTLEIDSNPPPTAP